jgi:uncharacterized protein YndB with AHSA1/START domain
MTIVHSRARQQLGLTVSEISITVQTNQGKADYQRSLQQAATIRCRHSLCCMQGMNAKGGLSTMGTTPIARATTSINAPASKVWDALTKPELIKQYLFGTEVTTDWRVGSPITYRGEWQGKEYEDKGKILEIEPGKRLVSTFWSSLGGLPDTPENYKTVRYELAPEGDRTKLTITQDNNATQEEASHSEQNWRMVLDGIKKLLEG